MQPLYSDPSTQLSKACGAQEDEKEGGGLRSHNYIMMSRKIELLYRLA